MSEWSKRRKLENNEDMQFDFMPLIQTVLKRSWIIVLFAAVLGAASFFITDTFITPTYRTSFTAYVNNRSAYEPENNTLTSSDITASQSLVRTYSKIIVSRYVLMQAAELLHSDYTYAQLSKMVTTAVESDTEIISVYVTSENPQEAELVAKAIAAVSPDVVAKIVEGSSMQIIDEPYVPTDIYKPNYIQNIAIGAVAGAFLSLALIILKTLTDNRIRDEETLEEKFGIPVVGVIPDMLSAIKKGSDYSYNYSLENREEEA